MNNVIRFQPANPSRRMASGEGVAQILFFTGVRYQRMSDEACAAPAQQQRARRKRDRGEVKAKAGAGRKSGR